MATPSSLHGVTSIVAGNCGFTLAPVSGDDADYLIDMMAKVEGMAKPALQQGVPWTWTTFGDYLDALDGNLGVNAGFLVGHCALRREVMGDDAVGNEATPEQIARDARAAGRGARGRRARLLDHARASPTPTARGAAGAVALGHARRAARPVRRGRASTRAPRSSGSPTAASAASSDDEIDLMIDMSLPGQRPINWNVLTVDSAVPERVAAASSRRRPRPQRRGARVVALTMPTSSA